MDRLCRSTGDGKVPSGSTPRSGSTDTSHENHDHRHCAVRPVRWCRRCAARTEDHDWHVRTVAIAEVASYKAAQGVFAPAGTGKNLTKVFDTGAVPNPAFVEISDKLPPGVAERVAASVIGYGGAGAFFFNDTATTEIYTSL